MQKKIKYFLLLSLGFAINIPSPAQEPGNVAEARKKLRLERQQLMLSTELPSAEKAERLLQLGAWKEADSILNSAGSSLQLELVMAKLAMLQNNFHEAEERVVQVLEQKPDQREALLLLGRLHVQAWELPKAINIAEKLLQANPRDPEASLAMGRISMLQKQYKEALEWAKKVQQSHPNNAAAYLLESEVHFWNQQPQLAEGPLIKSLSLNPFDADARFQYGYAIWRRVDATQLDDMAAQWELALELNPLHYATHWHWGNGHTNLTYADYAEPEDEKVREALKAADSLLSRNKLEQALAKARAVQEQYPRSVLPDMLRGSAYYMAFEMDRQLRLDSARSIFERVLQKKKHYGPAHNAMAAVVKQKQLPYLAAYDSLTQQIKSTEITDPENFARVFPDVSYYPGDFVQKMVWSQLYKSIVYFPFLSRQDEVFVIPPLHIDLAIAMGSAYFRHATTFDNRQWMDIRGVGSGAAGIEYVVRGAYLERNVVLHEYVHQFHGSVFSDAENREVRRLYYQAMEEGRTLDYYSANNEHEYLAQTYPAYFEPLKVHPLNHKSMNTTSDLKEKDPELYQFLDSLVKRQKAYLQGDEQAMASNWAQVYMNLAVEAGQEQEYAKAAALLDTALQWDAAYQPALITYAGLQRSQKAFEEARRWLDRAIHINPAYAPLYVAEANLLEARRQAADLSEKGAVEGQEALFLKAMDLEDDLLMRAYTSQQFREFYASYGKIPQAVSVAEAYVDGAPVVSTYLRDRRDEALAYANWLKGKAGSSTEAVEVLAALVSRKPQHFNLRLQYADVLAVQEKYLTAYAVLEEGQRILTAAGKPRADYMIRMAAYQLAMKNRAAAVQILQPVIDNRIPLTGEHYRLVVTYSDLELTDKAQALFMELETPKSPAEGATYHFAEAKLLEAKGEAKEAIKIYRKALQLNPYEQEIRRALIQLLVQKGEPRKVRKLKAEAHRLRTAL